MKICYFDAFSGISGDMTVGACSMPEPIGTRLKARCTASNLGAIFRVEKTKRKGIAASKFSVDIGEQKKHRHLPHIEKIIARGDLSETSAENALAVFRAPGRSRSEIAQCADREGALP